MPCAKHSLFERRKIKDLPESYVRADDWWKSSAGETGPYAPTHRHTLAYRTQSGSFRKQKVWSVVQINRDPRDLTESEFNELVAEWRKDTRFHSSLSRKFTHWAYVTIIAAGKAALPLILKELEARADHWFYALRFIARRDVAAGTETVEQARQAWLSWGRENNYI